MGMFFSTYINMYLEHFVYNRLRTLKFRSLTQTIFVILDAHHLEYMILTKQQDAIVFLSIQIIAILEMSL